MLEPVKARGSRAGVDELLANVMTAKIDREIDRQAPSRWPISASTSRPPT